MSDTFADTIVLADRVHTLAEAAGAGVDARDDAGPRADADADAVAIAQGRILAVGSRAAIADLAGPDTRTLSFPGGTIVPGLVDAHSHPVYSLSIVRGTSFVGLTRYDDVIAALRRGLAEQAGQDWFFGWGLDPNAFEGRPIGNALLHDVLGADRPAYVRMFDAHSAIVTDEALRRAGVTEPFQNDDGSGATADDDGRLTGHLLEFAAMEVVERIMPARSFDDRAQQLLGLLTDMAAHGITGTHVQDLEDADALDLLTAIEGHGELPLRLRLSPWCTPASTDADVAALVALQGRGGRRFRVEGIKFFIDGTVEGGTAWLDSPDSKGEGTASTWSSAEAYAARIRHFHDRGITTQTHAIGERGVRVVAETLAALPRTGTQHRIEHIESVGEETIALIAASGIAASMQPTHCTHFVRADGSDDWSVRLGPARAARAWRTADVRRSGAVLALGSDWPVAPYDPWEIMADARLRRPADHPDQTPIAAAQALTAVQALEGYTTHAYRSIGAQGGALVAGAAADLVVVDTDPLEADPDRAAHTRVLLTVVAGTVVHQA